MKISAVSVCFVEWEAVMDWCAHIQTHTHIHMYTLGYMVYIL